MTDTVDSLRAGSGHFQKDLVAVTELPCGGQVGFRRIGNGGLKLGQIGLERGHQFGVRLGLRLGPRFGHVYDIHLQCGLVPPKQIYDMAG